MEVDGSYESLFQLLRRGEYSAESIVERFRGGDGSASGPMAEFARRTMKKGARELLVNLMREGFVVDLGGESTRAR